MSRGRGSRPSKPFQGKHRKARIKKFAAKHKGTKKAKISQEMLEGKRDLTGKLWKANVYYD